MPLRIDLGGLLQRQAERHADRLFLTLPESGAAYSYGAFNGLVNRLARGLRAQGIGPGGYVAIMLPNGVEFLAASYALKKLGAVEVAVNREFRGAALARMINLTGARVLITADPFMEALAALGGELPHLSRLIMTDGAEAARGAFPALDVLCFDELLAACDDPVTAELRDTDTAAILFTSGTTGVSKGCMLSHRYAVRTAEAMAGALRLTPEDCVYTPYPLFHIGTAYYDILAAMMVGARVALRSRFSARAFWPEVAASGATWFMVLGSVQQLLWAAPPCPEEKRHKVRVVWGTPLPVARRAFEERFGLALMPGGGYGSTDAGFVAVPSLEKPGGRVLPNFEVGIVDENDDLLPPDTTGEIVVRPKEPGIMADGYFGMPEKTMETRRNLWFHTGDLGQLDEAGDLHFKCRMTERIRVLGEMVSAYEIEEGLLAHPAVEDAAVIAVPGEMGDDDVKAFVVLKAGAAASAEDLRAFCRAGMSRFMVPKRIQFIHEMPRTPTDKPAKAKLAEMSGGT